MTFDLDLWPTDLNINNGHLVIKDYLPTKFEASWAKRSWVISCTRWSRLTWPLTLAFDLLILNINRGHILIKDNLPKKFEASGQSVLELSVAQGEVDWYDLLTLAFDLHLNINRGHLLIKDYLHTKFEASGAKHSWVISCTRLRDTDRPTDIPTDRHTDRHVQSTKGGINIYDSEKKIRYL